MKRLDTYLLRQFLNILVIGLLGFVTVFIVVDLIENLDRFIDNTVPIGIILKYYFFTLPWFINIALPMATLIATGSGACPHQCLLGCFGAGPAQHCFGIQRHSCMDGVL